MAVFAGPEIVNDGLVLHLDAANDKSYPGTGTTWSDLSGNGNNGTLVNGVGYSSDNKGSMTFDGVNDYVVTDRIPGTGTSTSSVSWCIWTKPAGSSGNIMSMSSANPQGSWNMPPIAASGGKFRGKIWANNYLLSESYTQGNWYYVCLVYNYSATVGERYQRLYVNGEQAAEQTGISYGASGSNNFLFFGQANPGADNTGYYSGEIGLSHVYNKGLSASEIQQNFEATRSRYGI
jgi:hypothetical protein